MKKVMGLIELLYLFGIGFLCHLLPIPEIIKAFLSLPALLIIPKQAGEIVINISKIFIKNVKFKFNPVSKYVLSWIIGVYSLLLLILILVKLSIWSLNIFMVILLSLIFIKIIYKTIKKDKTKNFPKQTIIDLFSKNYKFIIPLLFLIGIVPVLLIKNFQPYPLHYSAFSLFNYLFETLKFTQGGVFELISGIHTPIIPLLIGISSLIFNAEPISIFWAESALNYLLFGFGIYLFSYQISKNLKISILTSFFGIWMLSTLFLKPLYTISMRTILAVIFPFILFLIQKEFLSKGIFKKENLKDQILLLIYSISLFTLFFTFIVILNMKGFFVFLLFVPLLILLLSRTLKENIRPVALILLIIVSFYSLIHIWMAMLSLPILFAYILIYLLLKNYNKGYRVIGIFFIFSLLFISLQKLKLLIFPDNFFSNIVYKGTINIQTFSFLSKYNQLIQYGPPIMIILFLIGLIFLIIKKDYTNWLIPATAMFGLFLYFFPENQFFRVTVFIIPFIAYTIALSIIIISKMLNEKKRNLLNLVYIALVMTIVILSLVITNYSWIQQKQNSEGFFSPDFEMYEYQTANWINENTPKEWPNENFPYEIKVVGDPRLRLEDTREIKIPLSKDTLIISDPHTMWVLQGLTGRDQPIYQRGFVSEKEYAPEWIDLMQHLRSTIFLSGDSKKAYEEINKIKQNHKVILIVITPRTEEWIKTENRNHQFFSGILPRINNLEKFEIFNNPTYFTKVYSLEDKTYIFEVNAEEENK